MCVSLPGQVMTIERGTAEVESLGTRRRLSLIARPDARVGDWVLFGAGLVLEVVSAEEAAEVIAAFDEIERAMAPAIPTRAPGR